MINRKTRIFEAYGKLSDELGELCVDGHWRGELSSSALSTATAAFALYKINSLKYHDLICDAINWLARNINDDGGYGDTVDSPSNISTTLLVWSAMSVFPDRYHSSVKQIEGWIESNAGGLDAKSISDAVYEKYEGDKTFSVPILTMCALAGRLGEGESGWGYINSLPFELSVMPHGFYKFLKLPVVSYALPALISFGLVKFIKDPPENFNVRLIRKWAVGRSLNKLKAVQPGNGGFLEAIPLTSFVAMSLCGCGYEGHDVVKRAESFIEGSIREDGSFAIDTDLSTWVSTLCVNGLSEDEKLFSGEVKRSLSGWLLGQQYRVVHPFTNAKPGGWGWTDLPGAVPDADDTSSAIVALSKLEVANEGVLGSVRNGVKWLCSVQNSDGGVPTFCRGWNKMPFDRSTPDITANALAAIGCWYEKICEDCGRHIEKFCVGANEYLSSVQSDDGSWVALWFGNQSDHELKSPLFTTSRVLVNLARAIENGIDINREMVLKAVEFISVNQNADGGFGSRVGIVSSIEETSSVIEALCVMKDAGLLWIGEGPEVDEILVNAIDWLLKELEGGEIKANPIGLYFAELWYDEKMYPLVFSASALMRIIKTYGL